MNQEDSFNMEELSKEVLPGHKQLLHFKRMGRELAMQYLFQCDLAGEGESEESMECFWEQAEESGEFPNNRVFRKARTYAEKLILGVQANEFEINDMLENASKRWNLGRMSAVDRNIMRIAIYELKFCPDIPPVVIIDEAIEIGKDFSGENSGVFINGLLNGIKNQLYPELKSSRPPRRKAKEEPEKTAEDGE